jgi:hypothetical protein
VGWATVPAALWRPAGVLPRCVRADRTLVGSRSRCGVRSGHTAVMHRESAVPTTTLAAGEAIGASAMTAVLLALSLLLLL